MRNHPLLLLCVVASLAAVCAPPAAIARPQPAVAAPRGGGDRVTAAELRDYLTFIASDELAGRDTPSRGLDAAAKYLAEHLSRWGIKPGGDDGTYFQTIGLRRARVIPAQSRMELNGQAFAAGDDFLVGRAGGSAAGQLVYAGHGYMVKARNLNPYAGLEVKDRILIVNGTRSGLPKGVEQADLRGQEGEDWDSPTTYARRNGARGIVYVPDFAALAGWPRARGEVAVANYQVEKFTPPSAPLPSITAGPSLLAALFRGEKVSGADVLVKALTRAGAESFALAPDKQLAFTVAVEYEPATTQNVVGIVEGSDPALKSEYVALGAHYDHIGARAAMANEDTIYNGADDDGSGTVAVLALAEAFARGPRPKRSILFVWHAGEEKGLWGSRYFTEYPTVPLGRIVAQLNIDMIGRSKAAGDTTRANRDLSGPNEIYVIGSKMMSSELGALSEAVNRNGLNLNFNTRYDDPKDPNRFFFRSDHYNYAKKGIPIIFYFDGVHEDYHRASDQVEKIDFAKMEKVTRTVYATAWEIANLPKRPAVDRQLPAELAQPRRRDGN